MTGRIPSTRARLAGVACACLLAEGAAAETAPETWWVDRAHEAVAREIDDTAAWFDGRFDDPATAVEQEARAFVHVTVEGFLSAVAGEDDQRLRVRAGADLPRFRRRLRLVVSSDADATLTGRDLAGVEPDATERFRSTGGLGLRYLLTKDPRDELGVGVGIAGGFSPEAVAGLRWRRLVKFGDAVGVIATPNLYWGTDRGAGFSVLGETYWRQDEATVWRASLFSDLSAEDGDTDFAAEASWSRRLDRDRSLRFSVGGRGEAGGDDRLREVYARVRWRFPAGRPWAFASLEPGLSWHEKSDYAPRPTISLRVEALFARER